MAASLVGGAAVGAVFGELLSAVLKMKDKAIMFKPTLAYLQSTLEVVAPVIEQIERQNNDLGRPKEELERLIREMEEGTKLVFKCSKINRLNLLARVRYQDQLVALVDSLVRFFNIDMQAQIARDLKETLLKVRRIHSTVNKLSMFSTEDTSASFFGPTERVMEHSLTQEEVDQSEAKADNNQEMEHLMSERSYDEYLCTDENRFRGICLPNIEPILLEIGGFNSQVKKGKVDPRSDYCKACGSCLKQNATLDLDTQGADDKTSYSYCNRCHNERAHRKIIAFQGCSYDFDLEDLCASIEVLEMGSYETTYDFDLADLFAVAEVLEKGSYGTTYKATLLDGPTLAVKRLNGVMAGKEEFEQQLEIVHKFSQHPNVIPLLASYYSRDEKLMIYDYIVVGSFSSLLHGIRGTRETGRTPLDWDSRLKISLGAARGIAHIHSSNEGKFIHGNINSSTVLVTQDFEGFISDFGFACLVSLSVNLSGNEGYRAPEVTFEREKWTQKSDVYSFGVVLCEMLTGKAPDKYSRKTVPDDYSQQIIDLALVHDVGEWADEVFDLELRCTARKEEVFQMVGLATKCVAWEPGLRPSMEEVVKNIEEIRASN